MTGANETPTATVDTGAPPVADESQDFDAAFAEFASRNDAAGAATEEVTGGTIEGRTQEPAPASTEAREEPTAGADAPPAEQVTTDLWANATPEQRAAFEAAAAELRKKDHEIATWRGRAASYRSRSGAGGTPKAARPMAGQVDSNGDAPKPSTAILDENADFKKLKDEYPEVAKPLEAVIRPVIEQNAAMGQELAEITAERQVLDEQATVAALGSAHPDWEAVTKSKAFGEWAGKQPAYVREALVRNGNRIVDVDEAVNLIDRFKRDTESIDPPSREPDPSRGATLTPQQIAARRQRQLVASVSGGSRGPGTPSGPPDDFDNAFAYYAARKAAKPR